MFLSHVNVSLSYSLPPFLSKINEHILRWGLKRNSKWVQVLTDTDPFSPESKSLGAWKLKPRCHPTHQVCRSELTTCLQMSQPEKGWHPPVQGKRQTSKSMTAEDRIRTQMQGPTGKGYWSQMGPGRKVLSKKGGVDKCYRWTALRTRRKRFSRQRKYVQAQICKTTRCLPKSARSSVLFEWGVLEKMEKKRGSGRDQAGTVDRSRRNYCVLFKC